MANRVRDWTAPRTPVVTIAAEPGSARRYVHPDHDCDRGDFCPHHGESKARCSVHGTLLQWAGSHEFGNRYLKGLCYQCLPAHGPGCPMASMEALTAWLLSGNEMSCFCPSRLSLLGLQVVRCKCDICKRLGTTNRLRLGAVFHAA